MITIALIWLCRVCGQSRDRGHGGLQDDLKVPILQPGGFNSIKSHRSLFGSASNGDGEGMGSGEALREARAWQLKLRSKAVFNQETQAPEDINAKRLTASLWLTGIRSTT
jgi:hypothetical protein